MIEIDLWFRKKPVNVIVFAVIFVVLSNFFPTNRISDGGSFFTYFKHRIGKLTKTQIHLNSRAGIQTTLQVGPMTGCSGVVYGPRIL